MTRVRRPQISQPTESDPESGSGGARTAKVKMSSNSDKLRIVHVADYVMPTMGYQEFALAKWNVLHGHEVHVITGDRYTPVPDYEHTWEPLLGSRIVETGVGAVDGVAIHRIPCALEFRRRIWLSGLGQKIDSLSPDVVLCHGTTSPLAFALPSICRKLRIPLIMDNHMAFVAQRTGALGKVYYSALRMLTRLKLNDHVCCFLGVSQESCDFMIQEQAIPPEKVQLLDIGVDTDLFRPDDSARLKVRSQYDIPAGATIVMQTGKLTRDKSPHWLTEAMAPIMKQDPNIWLVFVGAAPSDYLDEIMRPIHQHQVTDRLRFIPLVPVHDLISIYNMADVCVYPDASSLSCMEAAACGRPVIVTDLPWGRSRQEAGATLCYKTGDTADLRCRVKELISDPDARQRTGQRARRAVLESYSYDVIAFRLESLMRQAIADSL